MRTHAPLIFAFPPPPGCAHRPEFDAVELQWKTDQRRGAERDDDQDRYLGPDTSPSLTPSPSVAQLNNLRSIPARSTRERSQSVTNEPGSSRARSSGTKPTRPSAAGFETPTLRQPRSHGSNLFVGPVNVTVSDRLVVTGNGLLSGTSEYVMMDRSVIEGLSPARVAKAARESASSASEERERSRHRSDSLFTCSDDVKGKRGGGVRRKRSFGLPNLTRPPPVGPLPLPPPSSFEYKYPNHASSTSLSPSVASSSSSTSTIVQHDSGKGRQGLTVPEGAHLNAFPNQGTEIDVRSLNLHLRVRVVEILGCSEAMWEWVREFQHRELEKEKKKRKEEKPKPAVQGVGGGRVSYYHRDRTRQAGARGRVNSGGNDHPALRTRKSTRSFTVSVGNEKRGDDGERMSLNVSGNVAESPTSYFTTSSGSGSGKEDDPGERMKKVRQELLHLTRERFDEVLSWFQL